MSFLQTERIPDDPKKLPPARRRRAGRLLLPLSADEREAFIDTLAHRASPSFDFFLFSLLSGLVIAFSLLVDVPSLLILGALLSPLMAPIVGLALGTVTGSMRFFARSLLSLLIASTLVFLCGVLVGALSPLWQPLDLTLAHIHAQLAWHNFLVLALGSILTTFFLVRGKRSAIVFSIALAYQLYVPLTVAGFGLGSGVPHLWPDGLVLFAVHLAWAALLGAITLAILGFRPLTLFGYSLGGVVTLIGIILLIGLSGAGAVLGAQIALPTPSPTPTYTPTATLTSTLTPTITPTPLPPTATLPPTITLTPSVTPTFTPSPSPTPVYGLIDAPEEMRGAILRAAPGFSEDYITSVLNGTLIEVISVKPVEQDEVLWLFVRLPDGQEGWMVQSALLIATPVPNW